MRVIGASEARAHLAQTLNRVVDDREPAVVHRAGGEAVVILALDGYETMVAALTQAATAAAAD